MTQATGPDSHMIGLGDLLLAGPEDSALLYTASGRGGGIVARAPEAGLALRGTVDFTVGPGLPAPRQLHLTEIDGTAMLLAPGRYGTEIDAWSLRSDGTPGAARPLAMSGGTAGAVSALAEIVAPDGTRIFVTADRYGAGLHLWRPEAGALRAVAAGPEADFLPAGAVAALAVADLATGPRLLVADAASGALLGFAVTAGGLGAAQRLDLRDGLFVDTPTALRVAHVDGVAYALLGAAGSGSVTVVAVSPEGAMRVTDQVGDTGATAFDGLVALDALETPDGVFVLAAGNEGGLTLMRLLPGGRLMHLATLHDTRHEMALSDIGGLEMAWRDGGIDIFATGEIAPGQTVAGRGVTQLRVDAVATGLPRVHEDTGARNQFGTPGPDLFVRSGAGQGQQVYGFEPGIDRLDLSGMGRFYSAEALDIRPTASGAVIALGQAQVTVFTAAGDSLTAADFSAATLLDLWHVDVTATVSAPLSGGGTVGPDLLDGRAGDDRLLGAPVQAPFDALAAQVFRLYHATLDRNPDLVGLLYWVDLLASGARDAVQVAAGFADSAEFRNTYGATDDRAFVSLLYHNVLGRAPDAVGLASWTDLLVRGEYSRAQVVLGFSDSAEFRSRTDAAALSVSHGALQAAFSDEVFRLYHATLGRNPDHDGFLYWTGALAGGLPLGAAIAGFTGSAEFQNTYGATDAGGFVGLLYDNVLGRPPDSAGLVAWLTRMAQGWSREAVVEGFAESPEFVAATAVPLRDWMLAQGPDDVLDGGGGTNLLMGGAMSDVFVFRAHEGGRHVVVDAEPWDVLRLEGFGYGAAPDLAPHLRPAGADSILSHGDVTIEFLDMTPQDVLSLQMYF